MASATVGKARSESWHQRKKARAYAALQNALAVPVAEYISSQPTHVLCVVNGGRDGYGGEEVIRDVFGQYGNITHLVKVPGQGHAVIAYENVGQAISAREALHGNGCPLLVDNGRVLYVEYIHAEHLPVDILGAASDIPGLRLGMDFITEDEETALLEYISQQPWHTLRRRRVQHYGYRFDYATNSFDPDPARALPLPGVFAELSERVFRLGLAPCVCDQLTINEYTPGGGISAHVDTHSPFEDGIVSVSLGSHTVLEFRHADGRHVAILVPRRSVFVMTGEARYDWTHAIAQRKGDIVEGQFVPRRLRTSLTYRKIRAGPCQCSYPALCDTSRE